MSKMTIEEAEEILEDVADEVDGRVRHDYSGRCMYGKRCLGIVCDDATRAIEAAAARGIRGARQDSMGLSAIVYWPSLEVDNENENEE